VHCRPWERPRFQRCPSRRGAGNFSLARISAGTTERAGRLAARTQRASGPRSQYVCAPTTFHRPCPATLPRDCRTITGLTRLLDLTGRVFLGSALGQRGHGLVDLYGDAFRPRPRSAKGGYSARLEIYAIQPQSFRNSPPLPSPTAAQNVGLFHDMLSPSSHHLCVYLWSRGGLLRDRGRDGSFMSRAPWAAARPGRS